MILDEIEEDEWALSQILANPVMFREFINENDPIWQPLEDHERAWTSCTSHHVCMCCGRSVHKTTSMIEMLYYWMINELFVPGDPGLFVLVPNKAQKDVSFPRIRSACLNHWLIKQYVSPTAINIQEGRVEFKNGFTFIMRIAGTAGTDANVIGVHTMRIWVDEAQEFPWQTWLSLQNCLKVEIPTHQLFVSGVPNGERQKNVLFECDQIDEKYISFNIAQTMMTWWTVEMEYQKRKEYQALQDDSEDYKHYVLGQHGVPTFAVFDRTRFLLEDYDTPLVILNQKMFESAKRVDSEGNLIMHIEEVVVPIISLPKGPGYTPLVGVGYDVGYSPDPAVFLIIYLSMDGTWRVLSRYVLQRVEYIFQRETLNWLDNIYHFNFIGLDMGGPGKVQYQDLAGENTVYPTYDYANRIFPVEFGGKTLVAAKNEKGETIEKYDNTKSYAVETLSRWIHEHRLAFAKADANLMEEIERTKVSRSQSGEPLYRTDNDHQMAALMCGILAYENKFGIPILKEKIEPKPRLLSARWFDATQKYGARV